MVNTKNDGRKIPREALEYLRKLSIKLWRKGKEVKEIAEDFEVSLTAVYNWINIYKKEGMKGLKRSFSGCIRRS